MADDDPVGILLLPPDEPNPYPHIRGDDRYFKTYDPFGMPVLNTSLPAAAQPSWWERRWADYDRYMDRGGLLGTGWGMLPPEVRKSWEAIPTLWAETTPGAGVRDMVQSSGDFSQAVQNLNPWGMLTAGSGMVLGAIGAIPGGKPVVDAAKGVTKLGARLIPESWRRARQQGYNTRLDLYHATTGNFDQFDHARYGTGATLPGEETGVTWLTSRPDMADSYLRRATTPEVDAAAREAWLRGEKYARPYAEGANIMPVWVRDMDKFYVVKHGVEYDPSYISKVLRAAREQGAPGVIFKNFRDPGDYSSASRMAGLDPNKPGTVVAVFADEKIRSKYARFDPNRMNERNLMAGIVPVMTAGGLVLLVPEPADSGS